MYQSQKAAEHSHEEHGEIVAALAAGDEALAVRLMDEHLLHVEANLTFERKASQQRHFPGLVMTLPARDSYDSTPPTPAT
jgi:DNA-binding GntR family transcriptional regulator